MPAVGLEPAVPASKRPQIRALDLATTEIGDLFYWCNIILQFVFACLGVVQSGGICGSIVQRQVFFWYLITRSWAWRWL